MPRPDPHANAFQGWQPAIQCNVFYADETAPGLKGWWWRHERDEAKGPFDTSRTALLDAIRNQQRQIGE